MAAGLGFKDFTTGEVLTAADVDGYLMQGIWVFASATARDAAVTSPQEGNFAYLKDTNVTTYYTGSAWANLDTTGMTNPMTTTGDTIYSSSGSTPARLGIGTTGQVLTVAAGVPSWATPAAGGGGMVKIAGASFTTQTTVDVDGCFTSTYKRYLIALQILTSTGNNGDDIQLQFRYAGPNTQTTDYYGSFLSYGRSSGVVQYGYANTSAALIDPIGATIEIPQYLYVSNVGNSSQNPLVTAHGQSGNEQAFTGYTMYQDVARTYTGFRLLKAGSGTVTGSYGVYGLEN
jgi:hypothetical protein